jgi:hypothetical protein
MATGRNLVRRIAAYINNDVNGETTLCETRIPESGIFNEFPTITHSAGPVSSRPKGNTVAYALTITRCPELYASEVDVTPDPGENFFEATAIIKDEICICTVDTILGNLAVGFTL